MQIKNKEVRIYFDKWFVWIFDGDECFLIYSKLNTTKFLTCSESASNHLRSVIYIKTQGLRIKWLIQNQMVIYGYVAATKSIQDCIVKKGVLFRVFWRSHKHT